MSVTHLIDTLKEKVIQKAQEEISFASIEQWNNSQYQYFSKLIADAIEKDQTNSEQQKDHFGRTISASTLKRIFKYKQAFPISLDGRQLKTLDKLSIFVGFSSWIQFQQGASSLFSSDVTDEKTFREFINGAMQAEFKTYQLLPKIDLSALNPYFLKNSAALQRIHGVLQRQKQEGSIITLFNNPSTCELVEFKIIQEEATQICIETKEYWYLRWEDQLTHQLKHIYNELNQQVYLIMKTEEGWRIKMNYYESPKNQLSKPTLEESLNDTKDYPSK